MCYRQKLIAALAIGFLFIMGHAHAAVISFDFDQGPDDQHSLSFTQDGLTITIAAFKADGSLGVINQSPLGLGINGSPDGRQISDGEYFIVTFDTDQLELVAIDFADSGAAALSAERMDYFAIQVDGTNPLDGGKIGPEHLSNSVWTALDDSRITDVSEVIASVNFTLEGSYSDQVAAESGLNHALQWADGVRIEGLTFKTLEGGGDPQVPAPGLLSLLATGLLLLRWQVARPH